MWKRLSKGRRLPKAGERSGRKSYGGHSSRDLHTTTPETLSNLGGKSALKVYLVQDANPATTIFACTQNYVYNTALGSGNTPYGTKGFIVVKKGGDAAIFREGQAQAAGWPSGTVFQTQVGMMPGDVTGTVGTSDPATTLKFP